MNYFNDKISSSPFIESASHFINSSLNFQCSFLSTILLLLNCIRCCRRSRNSRSVISTIWTFIKSHFQSIDFVLNCGFTCGSLINRTPGVLTPFLAYLSLGGSFPQPTSLQRAHNHIDKLRLIAPACEVFNGNKQRISIHILLQLCNTKIESFALGQQIVDSPQIVILLGQFVNVLGIGNTQKLQIWSNVEILVWRLAQSIFIVHPDLFSIDSDKLPKNLFQCLKNILLRGQSLFGGWVEICKCHVHVQNRQSLDCSDEKLTGSVHSHISVITA